MMEITTEGKDVHTEYQISDDTLNELIVSNIEDLGLDGEVSFTAVREELKHYDSSVLLSPRDWTSAIRDCAQILSLTN